MTDKKVIIIGSGLGGLLTGCILSKEGYNVTVLEKNRQIGGCLQVFARKGCIFNTGLNYTEGLAEGQNLYKYFKYIGIIDKLNLRRMDMNGFEVITYNNEEYKFAQGHENFIETLTQKFPNEKQTLTKYVNDIKKISSEFPLYNLRNQQYQMSGWDSYEQSISEYFDALTDNNILKNVLCGTSMLYAGLPKTTPFYIHALINHSFINSSWRLVDGSHHLAIELAKVIQSNGGIVLRNKEVKKLIFTDKEITSVKTKEGELFNTALVISNIHPVNTLKMIEGNQVYSAYRNRVISLQNTIGMFTIYVVLKENTFEYQNYNHYYHNTSSVWSAENYFEKEWPDSYMLYTLATSKSEKYADSLIIMSYMSIKDVEKWENTWLEQRGEDYLEFKKQRAEKLLDVVEKKIKNIRNYINCYYTSTPLTYRDYTGTPEGSSYGILKESKNLLKTIILPKTKIENLFFTGQNLNMHGILGVTISSVMTCAEIIGQEYLVNKIIESNAE